MGVSPTTHLLTIKMYRYYYIIYMIRPYKYSVKVIKIEQHSLVYLKFQK